MPAPPPAPSAASGSPVLQVAQVQTVIAPLHIFALCRVVLDNNILSIFFSFYSVCLL